MNQLLKKALIYGMAVTTMMTVGIPDVYAYSTVEMTREIKNYKTEKTWDDPDTAPTLRITIKDGYKLKGKKEVFQIDLTGAKWIEEKNTTLSFSNTEGIAIYDAYISTESDTQAKVNVEIPKDMEEGKDIVLEIPLVIKVEDDAEEVSAFIKDTDSKKGLVEDAYVPLAITTSKQMNWTVGEMPTIHDGEAIAPITFKETQAGILGSREIDFWMNINNKAICFDEPEYLSKTVNSDDIDYELDPDIYLSYEGGFTRTDQKFKVSISKDGMQMHVRMSGSVPSEKGIIVLKNLPVKSTTEEKLDEAVSITLQGDTILNNNGKADVAYFKTKEAEEDKVTEDVPAEKEETEEPSSAEEKKSVIQFKLGEDRYILNDEVHKMDGKTYIKAPGYTMVPVRYVAQALGVTDIKFQNQTMTFDYEGKEIALTNGSTLATVDGQLKALETSLETVDGRIYAPIGSIANLLGIEKSWDNAKQTAIFIK